MSVKFFTGLSVDTIRDSSVVVADKLITVTSVLDVTKPLEVDKIRGVTEVTKFDGVKLLTNRAESGRSVVAPYSTIFDKFLFKAEAVYNFFEENEERDDKTDLNDRALADVPRYIKLSWRPAPDIENVKGFFTDKTFRDSPKWSGPLVIDRNGAQFVTDHIDVTRAKESTANDFVTPVLLRTNVEANTITRVDNSLKAIDEDLFLASDQPLSSINELKSNLRALSDDTPFVNESQMVSGKFMLQRSVSGESLSIRSGQPSSPSITLIASTAIRNVSKPTNVDTVIEMLKTVSQPVENLSEGVTKVNFVEPNIANIVGPAKIDGATRPEHAESMVQISQMLPGLEMITPFVPVFRQPVDPPAFPTPEELSGLTYIGYVIEKYKRSSTGVFELVEEIDVNDRKTTEYVDTRVVYGGVYRYRIKTILRWVHAPNVDIRGTIDANSVLEKFSQTKNVAGSVATFFESDWSKNWAYAAVIDLVPPDPADELTVRPVSQKKQIHVSWKFPADPQKDIYGFLLYRKTIDQSGQSTSGWQLISDVLPPTNYLFVDDAVEFQEKNGGEGYVYAVQTISKHGEYSVLSDQIAAWISNEAVEVGEMPVKFVSEYGVHVATHGELAVKPMKKVKRNVVVKDIVSVMGRVGESMSMFDDVTYVLRLFSHDTGEIKDVELVVDYNDLPDLVKENPTVVAVRPNRVPGLSSDVTIVQTNKALQVTSVNLNLSTRK